MHKYIARRLLISFPVLWGITVLIFVFINLMPGDPIMAMIDPRSPRWVDREALLESLGLNKPLPVRYVLWLRELIHGNLGYSYHSKEPIAQIIARNIVPTLVLIGTVVFITTFGGLLLGVMSALRPYSLRDYVLTVFCFSGVAMPDFFFALVLVYLVVLKAGMLPAFGMMTLGSPPSLLDGVRHIILPAAVLSFRTTASIVRYARASMLEVLNAHYLSTARAKGLAERAVIWGHAFRNALLPMITVLGLRLPWLVGGSVIVETIFHWPGMGTVFIRAVGGRDYPVIMATSLISAVAVLLANLIADIAYAFADPRIRYE